MEKCHSCRNAYVSFCKVHTSAAALKHYSYLKRSFVNQHSSLDINNFNTFFHFCKQFLFILKNKEPYIHKYSALFVGKRTEIFTSIKKHKTYAIIRVLPV